MGWGTFIEWRRDMRLALRYKLLLAAVVALCSAPSLSNARPPAPDAEYILKQWRAAAGAARAQSMVAQFKTIQGNQVTTTLIVAKAPNKVLIRTEYPWLDRTRYQGYDGRTAWQSSNLSDAAILSGKDAQFIATQAALFNSAELFPERWPIEAKRVPDVTALGRSYFAVELVPRGGASQTMLFDKASFTASGQIEPDGTVDVCVDRARLNGQSYCRESAIVRKGIVAGTIDQMPGPHMEVDDIQFVPPEMLHDLSVEWLLGRYRAALGPYSGYVLKGTLEKLDTSAKTPRRFAWTLEAKPPITYTRTITFPAGTTFVESFDGKAGTVKATSGAVTPDSYARLYAYAYNHCALTADACGIMVTRLPNVRLNTQTYYVLGVGSTADPSVRFALGLDPKTFLPAFADFGVGRLLFSDYQRTGTGVAYPRICNEIDSNGDFQSTVTEVQ
jgi:hypothetical protein